MLSLKSLQLTIETRIQQNCVTNTIWAMEQFWVLQLSSIMFTYFLLIPEVRIDNFQREDKCADITPHNMRGGFRAVKDFIWLIKISYRQGRILLKTALVILLNKVERKIGSIIIGTFTSRIKLPTTNSRLACNSIGQNPTGDKEFHVSFLRIPYNSSVTTLTLCLLTTFTSATWPNVTISFAAFYLNAGHTLRFQGPCY